NHKILDASLYGVPQKRLRNFFVITKGIKFDFELLRRKENIVTVKEAIGELYNYDKEPAKEYYKIGSVAKT
ncbi:hypothetical protein RFZ45_08925, partial [Acinetobacter baumannii]|nr:hypothetical protein [Acinetobacter baumannii]